MKHAILEARGLRRSFGGIDAVAGVDITIGTQGLLCVIGPNGAGKSTLVGLLSGAQAPDSGELHVSGESMHGRRLHDFCRRGVVRKFQGTNTFLRLSVRDNLMVAGGGVEAWRRVAMPDPDLVLEQTGLSACVDDLAMHLPHGQRQWLEIGMALMCRPALLLLDEPAAGMSAHDAQRLVRLLHSLRGQCAALVIEHDLAFVEAMACETWVMHRGQIIRRGAWREIAGDEEIRRIYREGGPVMLQIENLGAGYGGMNVLHGVSFEMGAGEVLAVLGCNGAGKTTLVKTIMGLLPATSGAVSLGGSILTGLRTHEIARRGIGLVPQGRWVFPRLTVRENIEMGTQAAGGGPVPHELFEYFPILHERLNQHAGTLSGGEQQVLAIARALCGRPRVLLLDEPSDGVQPSIVELIGEVLPVLCERMQLAVLLVEQNLDLVLQTAVRCIVLESGRTVHAGPVDPEATEGGVHPLVRYLSPVITVADTAIQADPMLAERLPAIPMPDQPDVYPDP